MAKIKFRRDTAAAWIDANPVLAQGEPGFEHDTGKVKYGDGVTSWTSLAYASGGTLTNVGDVTVQTGDADRWFVRLRREDSTENPQYTGVAVSSTNYDSEGNAIVAAFLSFNNGGLAIFKFTPSGELIWKRSVGTLISNYYIASNVVIDSDDNIIFAVNPDNNLSKVIVKVNGSTGAIIFSEIVDNNDTYDIRAIAVDNDGNIIVGGYFYWGSNNNNTAFVAKLNPTATSIVWQKELVVESGYSYINALEVDFNNDIVVAGYYEYSYEVNGSQVQDNMMTVAKITSAGSVSWKKDVSLEEFSKGRIADISLDSLGNIYATGTYYVGNPTDRDGWNSNTKSNAVVVFKISTLGVMVWDRRIGPGQCSWVGVSTAVGDDGDLYLYASTYQYKTSGNIDGGQSGGYWNATLALARYNKTTGAVIWQSYFDNPLAQEIPAWGTEAPWGSIATDLMTVTGDKILIGGSVRLGQSDGDIDSPWGEADYFNQGFLAQFDTDATRFTAEGWTLETSRIPGKLTNTLVATDSNLGLQSSGIGLTTEGAEGIEDFAVGISVRRTASKTNIWTFGKDGTFNAPADANIKLSQQQLGYTGLYGLWNNNEDDIWFESVCHDADGFAYVLGSDAWSSGRAHVYKFTPEGKQVWGCQLYSGSGASFYVEWDGTTYTVATVVNGGSGYKVGDRIIISGGQLNGTDGVNSLTLEVATISNDGDFIGAVSTVNIVSGLAPGSTGSVSDVVDYYDNARCEVRSISFDPVTGNPVVLISTPTVNGDTLDSAWTETVLLLIDSGSGAVIKTTTLKDDGDIYPNDVSISSTGLAAVVGEKYNEYNEYGAITPLAGSDVDSFWVLKSDIDAEHFPGEIGGYILDWWITGTGITDQARVESVNQYTGLATVSRQGSGAAFDVTVSQPSTLATITTTDLATASAQGTTVINADNIVTPGGWGNWLAFPAGTLSSTLAGLFTMNQVIPVTWAAGSTSLTGYVMIQFPGDGTCQFTPVDETGSSALAGTWYFDLQFKSIGSYSVVATAAGSNYVAGHKMLVLGNALGGTVPTNNLVITVDSVDAGAITSISSNGTPNAAAIGPYTAVTFTNLDTGSGAILNMTFDPSTGAYNSAWGASQRGGDYVIGDLITISGDQFAGGASPANDITFNVTGVDGSKGITNISTPQGSIPNTHLLISTDYGVDYSPGEKSFAIKQNLGGEAFIWTEDFNKAIGGGNTDWFSGVVWNADGTSLYAVGTGRYDVNYDQALVVKYSSTGTLEASKFINDDMAGHGATRGAVALMSNDSIIVVHNMYNDYRDTGTEILVTKLDSDLNIEWQQFIGVDSQGDGWTSPNGQIGVAVDPASDEVLIAWSAYDDTQIFNDDGIHLIKLDTDGEVLWKRMFGVHESDCYVSYVAAGNKFLSIHGDQFTVVGYTQAPANNSDNAFVVTLPLDGTGVGLHGIWTYTEPNDDKIKVWRLTDRTSTTFAPNVHSNNITATDNIKYYYTNYQNEQFTLYTDVILSNQGGAVEFADGSKQTFSTALVPQVRIGEGRYTIRPEDSGRHILIEESNYSIIIPNYQKVTLPVGFTFTVVNISNNTAYIANEESQDRRGQMWFSGGNDKTSGVGFDDNGSGQMVTLIKIKEGTYSNDGDDHGDIWMIAGADIFVD